MGHHCAHPGNRFWRRLYRAARPADLLVPEDERRLLDAGLGVTNLVNRTTTAAADLSPQELREGAARLAETVQRWRPATVAVLGLGAYRTAFGRPHAPVGEQPDPIGDAAVWVLPNPSGLQGHYRFDDMVALLRQVRAAADRRRRADGGQGGADGGQGRPDGGQGRADGDRRRPDADRRRPDAGPGPTAPTAPGASR